MKYTRQNLFTEQDDKIILKIIKENPGNLQRAFRLASIKIRNHSANSIGNRWYKVLRDQQDNKCFHLYGKTTGSTNGKNISYKTRVREKRIPFLKRIMLKLIN